MKRGFTLIELLVVISIISLLSSIVIASLNSAREKAEISKFIQEMDQVQNALELYRAKFGEYPNLQLGRDDLKEVIEEELVSNGFLANNINIPDFIYYDSYRFSIHLKGDHINNDGYDCVAPGTDLVPDEQKWLTDDYMITVYSEKVLPFYYFYTNESRQYYLGRPAYCIIP